MHRANGPESVEVAGIRAPGGAASAADPRSDNNGSALTKDQRIEKVEYLLSNILYQGFSHIAAALSFAPSNIASHLLTMPSSHRVAS